MAVTVRIKYRGTTPHTLILSWTLILVSAKHIFLPTLGATSQDVTCHRGPARPGDGHGAKECHHRELVLASLLGQGVGGDRSCQPLIVFQSVVSCC